MEDPILNFKVEDSEEEDEEGDSGSGEESEEEGEDIEFPRDNA